MSLDIDRYSFLISLKAEYEFNKNRSVFRQKNLTVPSLIDNIENLVYSMLEDKYEDDKIKYVISQAVEDLLFVYHKYDDCDDYNLTIEEYLYDYSKNWKETKNSLFDNKNVEYSCDATILLYAPKELKSYVVPEGVLEISEYAFCKCVDLEDIQLPNSLLKISDFAFMGCEQLCDLQLPDSIKELGLNVFYGCGSLDTINIPLALENLNGGILRGCYFLDIILPKNHPLYKKSSGGIIVDITGKNAIYSYQEEYTLSVNHTIQTILPDCFNESEINNIILHQDIKHFSPKNFIEDDVISNIFVESGNNQYCSINGVLHSKDRSELIRYPNERREVILEPCVEIIGDYAFHHSNAEKICIPSHVSYIGNYSFDSCWASEIKIPNSISIIPKYAFNSCASLRNIYLNKSISTIGEHAFRNCQNLRLIVIMNDDCDVAENAFEGCKNIQFAFLPKSMMSYGLLNDSKHVVIYDSAGLMLCKDNALYINNGDILANIPKDFDNATFIAQPNTRCIKSLALKNCKDIKKVYLPKTINKIESYAFYGCSALKEIWLYDPCSYDSDTHTVDMLTAIELYEQAGIEIEVDAFVNSGMSTERLSEIEMLEEYSNMYKCDLEEMHQYFDSRDF